MILGFVGVLGCHVRKFLCFRTCWFRCHVPPLQQSTTSRTHNHPQSRLPFSTVATENNRDDPHLAGNEACLFFVSYQGQIFSTKPGREDSLTAPHFNIAQTSHTSIIFIATPIDSFINGTGMRDAADCNNVKACFPVAVIYFAVVGMTSRGLSDDSWIQMCVREMGG